MKGAYEQGQPDQPGSVLVAVRDLGGAPLLPVRPKR